MGGLHKTKDFSVPYETSHDQALLANEFAQAREEKRFAARERIHMQVVHPIDTPQHLRDPLVRHISPIGTTLVGTRVLLAAVLLHGLVLLVFLAAGRLMGTPTAVNRSERVQVRIVEQSAPEPPPQVDAPAEEEGAIAPDFEEPIAPPPKPEPPKSVLAQSPPPSDASPPSAGNPEPNVEAPARRIIGLSMESTVQGGKGPSFATGTSRMGRTADTAADPTQAALLPSGVPGRPARIGTKIKKEIKREQRKASRIPTQSGVFVKPKRTRPSKPPFPASLKAQGIEGVVLVRVKIDPSGKVVDVTILQGSGHSAFDKAARKAARAERFTPATRDGKPVPFALSYSYRFRIED